MSDQKLKSLSYQYKRQMNDIVYYAYKDAPNIKELQDFRIDCYVRELKSRLGDCRYHRDGSSQIRIFYAESENWENILVTLIHEVSHHIDRKFRSRSGHDKPFYDIHKKLLVTALDMGIISFEGIQMFWNSKAQNARKLASLMRDYRPNPIPYKANLGTIFVYNSYNVKELLKERGYHWNGTDKSWYKEIEEAMLENEMEFLISSGICEADIAFTTMKGVVNRRKAIVSLYGVPYEKKEAVKELGYRWDKTKKIWYKQIEGEDVSQEDRMKLKEIRGVRFVVTK